MLKTNGWADEEAVYAGLVVKSDRRHTEALCLYSSEGHSLQSAKIGGVGVHLNAVCWMTPRRIRRTNGVRQAIHNARRLCIVDVGHLVHHLNRHFLLTLAVARTDWVLPAVVRTRDLLRLSMNVTTGYGGVVIDD